MLVLAPGWFGQVWITLFQELGLINTVGAGLCDPLADGDCVAGLLAFWNVSSAWSYTALHLFQRRIMLLLGLQPARCLSCRKIVALVSVVSLKVTTNQIGHQLLSMECTVHHLLGKGSVHISDAVSALADQAGVLGGLGRSAGLAGH